MNGAPRSAPADSKAHRNNPEAQSDRLRGGWFWSGDLAYRDDDGVFWFAGRVGDWLRVALGELRGQPGRAILGRFPDAAAVAVIGVPDPLAGDQVLVAIELRAGRSFDPDAFAAFLDAQSDLGTKWAPRFVRVTPEIPVIGREQDRQEAATARGLVVRGPGVVAPGPLDRLCTDDRCRP